MSLHVIVLLYPHGAHERGCTACVRSVLLSGWSGCRAVSAAVRPLCAVGLSGSCQAVTLSPDSDGTPLMSGSAVRLSDTCCQAVRESAVNAVRLSGTVRRCPGFAVRLSNQGSAVTQWTDCTNIITGLRSGTSATLTTVATPRASGGSALRGEASCRPRAPLARSASCSGRTRGRPLGRRAARTARRRPS